MRGEERGELWAWVDDDDGRRVYGSIEARVKMSKYAQYSTAGSSNARESVSGGAWAL